MSQGAGCLGCWMSRVLDVPGAGCPRVLDVWVLDVPGARCPRVLDVWVLDVPVLDVPVLDVREPAPSPRPGILEFVFHMITNTVWRDRERTFLINV